MTAEQKKVSEAFPQLPPPPPPAPPAPPAPPEKGSSSNTNQTPILPLINGKKVNSEQLSMTANEFKSIVLSLPNSELQSFKLKIPGFKTKAIKGDKISKEAISILNEALTKDLTVLIFNITDDRDTKVSPLSIKIIDTISKTPSHKNDLEEKMLIGYGKQPSKINSADLTHRKLILKLSQNQSKPLVYQLNGKKSSYSEIATYERDNPESDINFKSGEVNTLEFSENTGEQMSLGELQKIYSSLFENYDQNTSKKTIQYWPTENKSCLKFPKTFSIKKDKTFNIKCIDQHKKNELQIFDESENLVYSKQNYNNGWDGTLNESTAKNNTDKINSGTYYYMFKSQKERQHMAGRFTVKND